MQRFDIKPSLFVLLVNPDEGFLFSREGREIGVITEKEGVEDLAVMKKMRRFLLVNSEELDARQLVHKALSKAGRDSRVEMAVMPVFKRPEWESFSDERLGQVVLDTVQGILDYSIGTPLEGVHRNIHTVCLFTSHEGMRGLLEKELRKHHNPDY
ncbi:hypothetical protein JXA12_02170 [Candidatus Woesearchaeota archaeon]|nr:hypothetical protein [Candidatus Woesearchaeota archaeon]